MVRPIYHLVIKAQVIRKGNSERKIQKCKYAKIEKIQRNRKLKNADQRNSYIEKQRNSEIEKYKNTKIEKCKVEI